MKRLNLISLLLLSMAFGFAQDLHTPAELLKIMEASKLAYQVSMMDKTIECKDFSDRLNNHNSYRVSTEKSVETFEFKASEKAKAILDKAEKFFQSDKPDSAMVYYKKALAEDPKLYPIMTYIGQIYGAKGDNENAILWYKKAIQNNYIDYMAHWFLADTYLVKNDLKNAVDEIVIARILNRNNPRIKLAMTKIFEKAKRNTTDWCFNPQMTITSPSAKEVKIVASETWFPYAMVKAIWAYEPGYSKSMGVPEGQYSTMEDKEALISLILTADKAKTNIKKDPQLAVLKAAAESKHLQEYILYEIILPKMPSVAYQLPEEDIIQIRDYVLTQRHVKL